MDNSQSSRAALPAANATQAAANATQAATDAELDARTLNDASVQENLIREMLTSEYMQDQIERVVAMHRARAHSYKKPRTRTQWSIRTLSFGNLFCFGSSNHVDFSDLQGLVSLSGKNASGKSSLIDVLTLALFNDSTKRGSIVNHSAKNAWLTCEFSVAAINASNGATSEALYRVERTFGPKFQNIKLFCGNHEVSFEPHPRSDDTDTLKTSSTDAPCAPIKDNDAAPVGASAGATSLQVYDYISNVLGLGTYQDFTELSLAIQNREFLTDSKESTKHKLLTRLIDLDSLEAIHEDVSSEKRHKEALIRDTTRKLNMLCNGVSTTPMYTEHFLSLRNECYDLAASQRQDEERLKEMKRVSHEQRDQFTRAATALSVEMNRDVMGMITRDMPPLGDVVMRPQTDAKEIIKRGVKTRDAASEITRALEMRHAFNPKDHNIRIPATQHFLQMVRELCSPFGIAITETFLPRILQFLQNITSQEAYIEHVYSGPLDPNIIRLKMQNIRCRLLSMRNDAAQREAEERQAATREPSIIEQELNDVLERLASRPTAPEVEAYIDQNILENYGVYQALTGDQRPIQENVYPPEVNVDEDFGELVSSLRYIPHPYSVHSEDLISQRLQKLAADSFTQQQSLENEHALRIQSLFEQAQRHIKFVCHTEWIRFCSTMECLQKTCTHECCSKTRRLFEKRFDRAHTAYKQENGFVSKAQSQQILHQILEHLLDATASNNATYSVESLQQILANIQVNKEILRRLNQKVRAVLMSHSESFRQWKTDYDEWEDSGKKLEIRRVVLETELQNAVNAATQAAAQASNAIPRNESIQELEHEVARYEDLLARVDASLYKIRSLCEQAFFNFMRSCEKKMKSIQADLKEIESLEAQWNAFEQYENDQKIHALAKQNRELEQLQSDLVDEDARLCSQRELLITKERQLKDMQELMDTLKKLQAEVADLSLYASCVNIQTGIPSLIIKQVVGKLEAQCNDILRYIMPFRVVLALADVKRMKRKLKYLDIQIQSFVDKESLSAAVPVSACSGAQKFILDIVFRVVLLEVSPLNKCSMFLIDEGFGCLDEDNFKRVREVLPHFTQFFSTVLVISHQRLQDVHKVLSVEWTPGKPSCIMHSTAQSPVPNTAKCTLQQELKGTKPVPLEEDQPDEMKMEITINPMDGHPLRDTIQQELHALASQFNVRPGSFSRMRAEYQNGCEKVYLKYIGEVRNVFIVDANGAQCTICKKRFSTKGHNLEAHFMARVPMKKHVGAFVSYSAS
jgi:DNA repair exonuclease SbcCD ATPase subunit